MKKATTALPKDWTVVQSKTYPDRVFYFNKRTHETSWDQPKRESDESSPTMRKNQKKRKNDVDDSSSKRPTTPVDSPSVSTSDRPKLKAKRILTSKTGEASQGTSNDTPQMKAIRQKMLEKQLKTNNNVVKKAKTTNDAETKTPKKESTPQKKDEKLTHKPLIDVGTLTPQMKEVYEKFKARQAKLKKMEKKDDTPRKALTEDKVAETVTRSRTRAKSIGPTAAEEDKPSTSNHRRRTMFSTARKSGSDSECSAVVENNAMLTGVRKFTSTPSGKKNIAQSRIEKLRRSLADEKKETDSPTAKKVKKSPEKPASSLSHPQRCSLPSVYKNAEARIQALQERLRQEARKTKEVILPMIDEPDASDVSAPTEDAFYEAMDWEPIDDERILSEIQAVRNELGAEEPDVQMQEVPEESSLDLVDGQTEESRRALYIVIDTNVFLSNIQAIEQARDTVFKTHGRPVIVIPWTVIRELDYIKDDRNNSRPESLKVKARQAIRFLHQHFSAKHPRVLGQTARDVANNRQLFSIECPDDEILQTCLQIQKSHNSVVLLSYDKNLCNKAMIHDVATLGRNDPLEKIDYLIASEYRHDSLFTSHLQQNGSNPQAPMPVTRKELSIAEDLFEKIKEILKEFLTVIVAKEMQNLYGENWERYVIIRPPWSVITVLKCAIKHWMAAVNDSFIRRAESIIKDLHDIISKYEYNRRLRDVGYVIELTSDLVQCLIIKKYPNLIQRVNNAIQELKARYTEAVREIQDENVKEQFGGGGNLREQEQRTATVFGKFDAIYEFARDVCGTACELSGMPCSFSYKRREVQGDNTFIHLQAEVAGNINKLLLILSTALQDFYALHKDHRSVLALYHALENFCPEMDIDIDHKLSPIDVYNCLKNKEENFRLGVPQLQELSDHFCRLAAQRCR